MKTITLSALGLFLMVSPANPDIPDLSRLFPDELQGWQVEEQDGLYDGETLHLYINGSAEVYRGLNVRAVCGRRYVHEAGAEIIADIFAMGSASDAFGAYHHDMREGETAGIGQESEFIEGALAFWKGRFFISIIALQDDAEADRAVLETGRSVAGRIEDKGGPPDLLRLLPEENLLSGQVRYMHDHFSLGRYYSLSEDNVLNLDMRTEVLLARYSNDPSGDTDETWPALLLVRYPSADLAGEGLRGLFDAHIREADGSGVGRFREGKWAAARAVDRLLIAVFDSATKSGAEATVRNVLSRIDD